MKMPAICLVYLFHPLEALDILKRERERVRITGIVMLYAAALLSHLLSLCITHYPLRTIEPGDMNIALELLKVNGIVFTWVVAAFAISSIMGGEARFGELLASSAVAYTPYIVLSPVVALVSRMLSANNAGFYTAFQFIAVGWLVLGLVMAFVRQCDYGFGRAILVGLLSVIFMCLMWALLILFLSLCIQAGSFIADIGREIVLKGI